MLYWSIFGGNAPKYYRNETCSTITEMRKIFFDLPNYFEVIGMKKEADEVKKVNQGKPAGIS